MTQPSEKPEDAIVNANAALVEGLGMSHEEAVRLSEEFLEKAGPGFAAMFAILVGRKIKTVAAVRAAQQANDTGVEPETNQPAP